MFLTCLVPLRKIHSFIFLSWDGNVRSIDNNRYNPYNSHFACQKRGLEEVRCHPMMGRDSTRPGAYVYLFVPSQVATGIVRATSLAGAVGPEVDLAADNLLFVKEGKQQGLLLLRKLYRPVVFLGRKNQPGSCGGGPPGLPGFWSRQTWRSAATNEVLLWILVSSQQGPR